MSPAPQAIVVAALLWTGWAPVDVARPPSLAAEAGTNTLVSRDRGGDPGQSPSGNVTISGDGRWVAFDTTSQLVPHDDDGGVDVYLYDEQTHAIVLANRRNDGGRAKRPSRHPSLSSDGRYIVFEALTSDGRTVVHLRDLETGRRSRVARSGEEPTVSADGRLVAYGTGAFGNVYLFDTRLETTTLVSHAHNNVAKPVGRWPGGVHVSADGGVVVYHEISRRLVQDDSNATWDVFAYDVATGVNSLLSRGLDGEPGNGASDYPYVSADGQCVAFGSSASDLIVDDANGGLGDVFVADLRTGGIVLASRDPDGGPADGFSAIPSVSSDGTRVAFTSTATDLIAGEPGDGRQHTYLRDLATGTTELVTTSWPGGYADVEQGYGPQHPVITEDGARVGYVSGASDLVRRDDNGVEDVFVYRALEGGSSSS